jgi:hypothetical protein
MQVTGNSVVLVVTRSYLVEPGTHGRDRLVTAAFELRLDCLELGHQPLLRRHAVMREAQKREGLRFSLSPLLSVLDGEPPELDQPRLLRM